MSSINSSIIGVRIVETSGNGVGRGRNRSGVDVVISESSDVHPIPVVELCS